MLRKDPSDRFVGSVLAVSVGVFVVAMLAMYGSPISFDSPDQELEIADAPEPLHLNESGEVAIVTITYVGGEPIATDDLAIYIGSQEDGYEFSSERHWRLSAEGFTLEARLNNQEIHGDETSTFEEGDTITLVKTRGTVEDVDSLDLNIVVVNTEADVTIAEVAVTAE